MTLQSKLLLVTGASGFLGSQIVHLACDAGWQVRGLYRSTRMPDERVEAFVGDIGNAQALRKASDGVAAIVHAAGLAHIFGRRANDTTPFNCVNERGTGNVVEAALECGVPHVTLISSVSVYGAYDGVKCDESMPCCPQGPYAISKWKGERTAIDRAARGRCSLTILRFPAIYGEGDRGNVAKLIGALDRGHFIWSGSGQNRKCLIYKEDAARACLRALERPVFGTEIFNVSPRPSTMREIVTAICQALGRPVPHFGIPVHLLKAAGAISRGIGDPGNLHQRLQKFIRDDVYDGTKFETTFSFRPVISLTEGMRREVKFLRGQTRR